MTDRPLTTKDLGRAGVAIEAQHALCWKRRALRAEALLGVAAFIVDGHCTGGRKRAIDLLATDPAQLVRLAPELADIINPILEEYGE